MVVLDAATIHESFAQKAACPLESVDASYPTKVDADQQPEDLSPELEKTYSEKRKFWEDISRKRESYQRSESEVSRASQLTINESDSESCLPNIVSEEGDGTTEGISDVMRSETIEDINVPDISECSVAEKAHYFEEQIQKEMAKTSTTPRPQEPSKSERDKSLFKGKSIDDQKRRESVDKSVTEMTKETIDIEEKHIAESREIEKTLKASMLDDKWTKEMRKEPKDKKDKKKDTDEDRIMREEVQKIIAQPVMEVCKELLNKERELAEGTQVIHGTAEQREMKEAMQTIPQVETTVVTEKIVTQEKPEVSTEVVEEIATEPRLESPLSKEIVKEKTSGRKIITEETTIIYKVQKDGTLVQEQVLKSVQIEGANGEPVKQVPEVSMETKVIDKGLPDTVYQVQMTGDIERLRTDIKTESVPLDVKKTIEQFLEEEKRIVEEEAEEEKIEKEESRKSDLSVKKEAVAKQATDTSLLDKKPAVVTEVKQVRKEFESRIPISAAMAEKDKSQKETKTRTSSERLDERSVKSPISEKDLASPSAKKKEFESRIPKRIAEGSTLKDARKDLPGRKDGETITVTEKKSSEEMTSRHEERSTTKSTMQTFSKTFTDAQDAFKMFEDMSAMKDKDFATVTSKVDTKASSKIEKKEVVSSEISSGADKIITHEEKEKVERKKSSESKMTKESPAETVEEKTSKSEEMDKTAMQKLSMNVTEGREVIDASASESRAESKKEESFKLLEDKEGVATEKSGTSRIRESDVDVAIRIKKDETKEVEDTKESPEAAKAKETDLGKVEMVAQGQSYKESSDSFKVKEFVPSQKTREEADLTKKKTEKDKLSAETAAQETLEERKRLVAKEIEARHIAEGLIQSIESEIEKRSSEMKPHMLSKEYLDQLISESSDTDHEKLADDLTKKFESIMKKSQDESIDHQEATLSKTSIQEEMFEKGYVRDSISISEDITRDEESSLQDREESLPLSSARLQDRDITMSPSSISEQIELEETIDVDTEELEDISKPTSSPHSEKLRSDRSSGQIEPLQRDSDVSFSKDKVISEISGARVLEILEPNADSRQDSVDVPSLELDEHKISEATSKNITSLHESTAMDSLEKITQERDVTISEDTNVDRPPAFELGKVGERRRADSFEIESPPLVSPRTRHLHELEIKPVSWMIGDEKIRIKETVQPYQAFDQELEELIGTQEEEGKEEEDVESTTQRVRTSPQDESVDLEQESATKSSEEISVIESIKESDVTKPTTKFTVIPVSESETEPDFESELIENKLDVTCQELVDTLQREYEAKTPTDEYAGIRQSIPCEGFDLESSIIEAVTEDIPVEETKDLTEHVITEVIVESKPCVRATDKESLQREVSTTRTETVESTVVSETSTRKEGEKEESSIRHITKEETQEPVEDSTEKVKTEESEVPAKCPRVDDVLKEWAETYLSKIKPPSEDYKRHMEKTTEKVSKSTAPSSDTCALKIKKDDLQNVDLSARYAITVLDQVVKKEIAEVKESLEAAKQDLIEELSENSQTVIQIKDSPSEFQFKLQPESIPNDLPFLYKPPSTEHVSTETEQEARTETEAARESPVAKVEEPEKEMEETKDDIADDKSIEAPIIVEDTSEVEITALEIDTEKYQSEETVIAVHEEQIEDEEEGRPSPLPISRSSDIGSDLDYRDDSYSSLAPPQPAPRRRQKPTRISKRAKTSDSEADLASSSGESSNYHSCDYEGSGSRPSSSDVEAMHSAVGGIQSGTASEYETAAMSVEHEGGSKTLPTSQEYQTAASTLSSRESLKSLSSGHLGSIDSTSELSETLVPSEEADQEQDEIDEIDENLESALDADQGIVEASDSSGSEEIPMDENLDKSMDKIDSNIPCRMKRSSEMIFQQVLDDSVSLEEAMDDVLEDDQAKVDSGSSVFVDAPGTTQSRTSEDEVPSVCTQISTRVTRPSDSEEFEEEEAGDVEAEKDVGAMETDLEQRLDPESAGDEGLEPTMQATSVHSMLQQASMSLSSASGMSFDTVIEKDMEKDKSERHSDSDSFELVDKPDIIDDFVVIEEVGREAEEFDSEGKSIRISSMPQVTSKQYDRDLENLIAETKEDSQTASTSQSRNNDLFDFESEESPPQASNDDQYSQSYSDEEQYEGKKWIEMQFNADARVYDTLEYDRGPLEDIKEEEVTDFEAGSSRIGSLGSHKESIGSVGSMRGSFSSTPDYDVLGKKHFSKPTDHDNVSLSSLQEFEHLESALAAENSRKLQQCGSQDSINNGSLPRRYVTSRSGHGDDVSLSSLKDFEGLERACREAHLMELRAREEEELLEHESPENKYKMENLPRSRNISAAGSVNPSTSGSDDYEKRIKEIDEIIRIAQSNVEKFDRQDDTTEDISQIEITDAERAVAQPLPETLPEEREEPDEAQAQAQKETNIMETSTDSLELEDNADKKHHPLCRSSDSLEMKTTLDFPSLSSDSLNNMRDTKETPLDAAGQFGGSARRISSDSLELPLMEQQDVGTSEKSSDSNGRHAEEEADSTVGRRPSTESDARNGKTKTPTTSST